MAPPASLSVLVALDEAPVSVRAAQEAVRIFAGLPSVTFLVVNVARLPVPWVGAAGFGVVSPLIVDTAERSGLGDERELFDSARAIGIPDPAIEAREGDPVEQICAVADEHAVDVIVVGSHDKSWLWKLFSPSVADGVAHRSSRPVLVVSGEADV